MQIIKKLSLIAILSIIVIFSFEKYSYGFKVKHDEVFNYTIGQILGNNIEQEGWWMGDGRNSCTQANSDKGYSNKIVGVYETLYDSTTGRIVAQSVSSEGYGNISNADADAIRNFAAAMSIDLNIQGVRDALMKCMNSSDKNKSKLSYSATLMSNNRDGTTYGGSSSAWETANDATRKNYKNYQSLQKVDDSHAEKSTIVTSDGVEYARFGPYQMKFGTAALNGVYVNDVELSASKQVRYQIQGDNTVNTDFNAKNGDTYSLNNKSFYVLVNREKLDSILGSNSTTVTIKFTQGNWNYARGRTLICNNGNYKQGNAWYTWKTESAPGGSVSFTATYNPYGKIVIEKVNKNDSSKKVEGVSFKIYGESSEAGNGWVNSDGTVTSDFSSASTYKTGSDGKATIPKVKKGTFYIYEVGLPQGYDIEDQRILYPDSNDPKGFAGKEEYKKCVYLGNAKIESYNTVELLGIGQAPEGTLSIQKVDEKNISIKLQNVKFKIYGKTVYGDGWVKNNGTVTSNYNEATEYATDSNGVAHIKRLKKGTYYIYETDVPEGYDIEDQRLLYPDNKDPNGFAGKEEYGECVYLRSANSDYNSVAIESVKQRAQTPRDLSMAKVDKTTKAPVEGSGFKVLQKLSRNFKQGNTKFKKGTYVWLKSDGTISTNVNDAYEFKTGKDGIATVSNILSYGTCYVYETTAGGDYELIEQEEGYLQGKPDDYTGTFLTGEWVYMGSIEITTNTGTKISKEVTNAHTMGSLTLTKKDSTYKNDLGTTEELYLQGAKVKLYGETIDNKSGWVKKIKLSNGKIKYDVGSYSEAEEFTTDSNGKIKVDHLKYGTYYAYETQAPKDYNIKEQDGYHKQNKGSSDLGNGDWVYLGSTEVSYEKGKDIAYDVGNQKYIEIKGKVWLDEPDTKGNITDSIYNSASKDKLVSGMTVNLYNAKTGKKLATTTTNESGEYVFNESIIGRKITYWEASYCYIEFIYDNTKYISVNPFQDGDNSIANNSKAQEEEITENELDDNNLTGTTGKNPGIAITLKGTDKNLTKEKIDTNAKESMEKRLLTGYFNGNTYTIENINFGIIEKFVPDHTIGEELEYVKIRRGNYTFTYRYGDDAVTEEGDLQSTVNFQNSKKTFTQSVYPSDIKYNIANGLDGNSDKAYKVYVVYKVQVKNITTESVPDIYDEKRLCLTSLTNSYDTERYELSHDVLPGDDETISKDFSKWNGTSGTASYDLNDSSKKFKSGIGKNEIETAYIEYKVTDSALSKLVTEKQLAESPTVAKSIGYHVYERKDKNWKNKDTYTHKTVNEERENGSLYLKWKLFDTRTISGSVFEDLKDNSRPNERIGNGKYDSQEKGLNDVVVSLMNAEDTELNGAKDQETYLYEEDLVQNSSTGKWSRSKQKALTKVDENGNYSLKGVVPGKYYLKFTYGDGKTTITDLNGNIISVGTKIKGQNDTINSNYYKSTIITGAALDETNEKWYLNSINEKVNSIATDSKGTYYDENGNAKSNRQNIDIINARTTSDKEINHTSTQDKVVIDAISPNMDVQFEYMVDNHYQVTNNKLNELISDCTGMCFGIIERPHVEIELDKSIKNVKLTLSNGTNLINGNPEDKNVSEYLTCLDKANAKIETDYTNLYGSTVTIDYKLIAINNSELDYATKEYYQKGNIGSQMPVTTALTKIIDYVSYNKCNYLDPTQGDMIQLSEEYINNEGYTKEDYYEDDIINKNKDYTDQLLITETQNLTPKVANTGKSEGDYIVTVSKLLPSSNTEENLGWESYSEIIGMTNVTYTPQYTSHMGSYVAGDTKAYPVGTSEADNADAVISITPPTGKNKNTVIYIVAAGALIVIAAGVIIIKKFVL